MSEDRIKQEIAEKALVNCQEEKEQLERELATCQTCNKNLILFNENLEKALAAARAALKDLMTAVTFKEPTEINGVAVYEARVPMEFIDGAEKALALTEGGTQ